MFTAGADSIECYCYTDVGEIIVSYSITSSTFTLFVIGTTAGVLDELTHPNPTAGNCVSGSIVLDLDGSDPNPTCELPWSFCCDVPVECNQVCFIECPTCAKQKTTVNFHIGYERYATRDPDNPSTGADNAYPSPLGASPQAEMRVAASDPYHMIVFEDGPLESSGAPDYEYRSQNPSSLVFAEKHYPDPFSLYAVCDDTPPEFEAWYDDDTTSNTRVDDENGVFPAFTSGHYFESQPSSQSNIKYGLSTLDPVAGGGKIYLGNDCPTKPSDICDFLYTNVRLTIGDYTYTYVDNALSLTDHRLSTGYYENNPNPPYFKGFGLGGWSEVGASNDGAIIGSNMPAQLTAAAPANTVTFGNIPNGTTSGLYFDLASVRFNVGVISIELSVSVTRYYLWYFLDPVSGSWSADQYGVARQTFDFDNMFFNVPDCSNPITTLSTGSRQSSANLTTVSTRFNSAFPTSESVSDESSFPISMTMTGVISVD